MRDTAAGREARAELAPTGTLRVGINLANTLLVSGRTPAGDPVGVAPDMGREVARQLGVPVAYVCFATPGEVADAVSLDAWDIGLIAVEPARAETIAFSPPYVEIEATYMVAQDSPLTALGDVDRPGVRIGVMARSAYDLWLTRHLQHATIEREVSHAAARQRLLDGQIEVLAGLRAWHLADAKVQPGFRVLDGRFTAVQQAIGTQPGNKAAVAFLANFVREATVSGFVARRIDHHGIDGLLVPGT
jgi:polar amino acid transport system substrate-binding protein